MIYKLCADTLRILGPVNLPSTGPTTIYNGLNVTAGGKLVTKCFNGGKTEGWMVIVHPRTLRIEAQCDAQFSHRSSRAATNESMDPGVSPCGGLGWQINASNLQLVV